MAGRQTFQIKFYCRESKIDKSGFAPIELSLIINGKRTYVRLQRKERPEVFKKATESKKITELQSYCENQRLRVYKIADDMEYADIELTADNLKECFKKGGITNFYTLGQLWADIIDNKQSEMMVGDIEVDTYSRYDNAKKAFYAANNFDDNTPAKSVELQHINAFQHYLRKNLGLEQCTAYNYHARCKSAFTLAFNRGKIKGNPYAAFRMDKGERKDIVYLTEAEVNKIKNKQMVERLNRIRDLFIFQCYSGLAYSDMALLEKSDYQKNDLGQIFIQKRRVKTKQLFKSIVLKDGIEVLERYDYVLPVISNVKYNAYLKEIQTICNISKSLHTHLGRTTYICYLYNKGVPADMIAEIVGHASCYTTLKYYAKMDNSVILNEFRSRSISESVRTSGKNSKTPDGNSMKEQESEQRIEILRTTGIVLLPKKDKKKRNI